MAKQIDNYKALIESQTSEKKKDLGLSKDSDAFAHLANLLLLSEHDFGYDEIESGNTDGGGDGQVDSMYVIVNGSMLNAEDEEGIPPKGPIDIDIILTQCKYMDSFEENALKLIRTTVIDLIDLSKTYSSPLFNYSPALQEKFALARKALLASAGRTGEIAVRVFYITKGRKDKIHQNVRIAASELASQVSSLAAISNVSVDFMGAKELVELSRRPRTRKLTLEAKELLSSPSGDSFAGLVSIGNFMQFLCDDKADLVRGLFDANVRDFLGHTEVNEAIQRTLWSLSDEDFWWFNNGVTIVASEVDQKGKRLTLTDALVVNGLQTSNVLHATLKSDDTSTEAKKSIEDKSIIVKIIVPPNESVRDQIVKATNSQTYIPKPYLRGMDNVHRNIEDRLKSEGIYYERRKNQYKNMGKKRSEIVTLTEMSQSLMSAFMFRGSDARGRPNSLLKSDEDYQDLFSESYHLDLIQKRHRCQKKGDEDVDRTLPWLHGDFSQ